MLQSVRPSTTLYTHKIKGQISLAPSYLTALNQNEYFTCRYCTLCTITGTSGDDTKQVA